MSTSGFLGERGATSVAACWSDGPSDAGGVTTRKEEKRVLVLEEELEEVDMVEWVNGEGRDSVSIWSHPQCIKRASSCTSHAPVVRMKQIGRMAFLT